MRCLIDKIVQWWGASFSGGRLRHPDLDQKLVSPLSEQVSNSWRSLRCSPWRRCSPAALAMGLRIGDDEVMAPRHEGNGAWRCRWRVAAPARGGGGDLCVYIRYI